MTLHGPKYHLIALSYILVTISFPFLQIMAGSWTTKADFGMF